MGGVLAFFIILIIVLVIFAASGLTIVQQAETMVIERLGRFYRLLDSGINLIVPLIDKPREISWRYLIVGPDGRQHVKVRRLKRIDLRETVYDFPRQNVITRDNVVIEINALLYFQVTDPVKAVYEVANLPDAIEKLTQTTLRNVIGEMDLDETLSSRDKINSTLRVILDEATDKWGVKVNRVELQDINPPEDIRNAMEKQMRAERDRRAQILTAEGTKRAQILESEGIKESQINRAEGEKQAQILVAEAQSEARLKTARAEAEALEMIKNTLSGGRMDPSTYLVAQRYIDALRAMGDSRAKVVFMPFEASGVMSSIGVIKEMLTDVGK